MKKKYSPYALPPWLRTVRGVCGQFIIPISVFQGIRTLLFPTFFDVLLFIILLALAIGIYLEKI